MERREFLKIMGVGAGAVGASALVPTTLAQDAATPEPVPAATVDAAAVEAMDSHHQQGIQMFLDNVGKEENYWRKPLEFTMDGDTKVFQLTTTNIDWDTGGGVVFPAYAYNGMIPGPEFRVTEGDKVRILLTNNMNESTSIHWHGLYVPNAMDGVPFVTQNPVKPGETFTYEFTIRNSGSHMYHTHHNSAEQTTGGLLGAFIVAPKDMSKEPQVDAEYVMVLNDSTLGFTINGKGFPYTQPLTAKLGQKIRIRYMNEGFMIHPMHLHGIPQQVIAKDGWNLPAPYMADTVMIAPGERYDTIVDCTEPGIWAFHCHILNHAESSNGMFGMVTVLIVQ
jgi:FtsP/CotA-like multicopper oxidase with cupredoxin domain